MTKTDWAGHCKPARIALVEDNYMLSDDNIHRITSTCYFI